ncbi:MAG: peptidoglycan DD-metalloendopeptidase family protein [Candidatus Paceibacterota bacterium]
MKNVQNLAVFVIGLCIVPAFFVGMVDASAQSESDDLRALQSEYEQQIKDKQERQKEIEAEIKKLEASLQDVGAEKGTLQAAINQLELERRKVLAEIDSTQNKIDNTDLEIQKLNQEINVAVSDISSSEAAVAEILRSIHTADDYSLIEVLLRHDNISEFWNEIEDLETVRNTMTAQVRALAALKDILEDKRLNETERREQLAALQQQYSGQRAVLENNKADKDELLQVTKNDESNYQKMLEEKKVAREQLIKEVQDIESELKFILDPNTIPTKGTAVFNWPLDSVRITQYFGYTKFALANQGVYKNNMHNGVDLGAPTGTNVYAPLTGTVRATGNTDAVPGCYSWGKWMLIDHPNGLSTLFAHLSHIGVQSGQKVSTGDLVGNVGSTGYSTGPHLHYTLYASNAVQVKRFNEFKAVTGCGSAFSPFSAVEGYLDPLDYLPAL